MNIDRSYWLTESAKAALIRSRIESHLYVSYDDELFLKYLDSTLISKCPICGSELHRSIVSCCAGHGEFPRGVNYGCWGCFLDMTVYPSNDSHIAVCDFEFLEKINDLKSLLKGV